MGRCGIPTLSAPGPNGYALKRCSLAVAVVLAGGALELVVWPGV
jgi:hypothetical protein